MPSTAPASALYSLLTMRNTRPNVKNITVYKARNLLSNGNEFEPIYKTLVVTYIERMLRFYSGDFKQDKILTFFSNNPNSQKSRWDADRQYVNSILQDGDELDFSIDEKTVSAMY